MTSTLEKTETVGVVKDDGKARQVVLDLVLGGTEPCPRKSLSTQDDRNRFKLQGS